MATWLWLAFSSGGFQPERWLAQAILVGFFGLVAALLRAYPGVPGRVSLTVAALFALYSVWVSASVLWADSSSRAWYEAARSFSLLLVFLLAAVYLTDANARRSFPYLLGGGACFLVAVCILKLGFSDNVGLLFLENRFLWPVGYPNNAAALFLVLFWPLMWLAAAPRSHPGARGIALGLATALLGLAVMTQSRGAIYSLALSVIVTFVVSPIRLRTFIYLMVPVALLFYQFPLLNRYWLEGPDIVGGALGARTLLIAAVGAACLGVGMAYAESRMVGMRRLKSAVGTAMLLAVIGGSVYGSCAVTREAGGPYAWVANGWRQFTGQTASTATGAATSRFAVISSSGRIDIWRVALDSFQQNPLQGVGANNFIFEYDRERTLANVQPQHAHSVELQVLGETGMVGGLFAFGAMALSLIMLMWGRCAVAWSNGLNGVRRLTHRPPGRDSRWGIDASSFSWDMAVVAGLSYWLIHASVDWLWQMGAVAVIALLLLAAGLASAESRVGGGRTILRRASEPLRDEPAPAPRSRFAFPLVRSLLLVLSLVVIAGAGFPYLSLKYQESAQALASTNGVEAAERAATAIRFQPDNPEPYVTQASIYHHAALAAAGSAAADRSGAVLDDLALSISGYMSAISVEPISWSLHYQAGVETLNLMLAWSHVLGSGPGFDYASLRDEIPGLVDWSSLSNLQDEPPELGKARASLAVRASAQASARLYRDISQQELAQIAEKCLTAALTRNPLSEKTATALALLEEIG